MRVPFGAAPPKLPNLFPEEFPRINPFIIAAYSTADFMILRRYGAGCARGVAVAVFVLVLVITHARTPSHAARDARARRSGMKYVRVSSTHPRSLRVIPHARGIGSGGGGGGGGGGGSGGVCARARARHVAARVTRACLTRA